MPDRTGDENRLIGLPFKSRNKYSLDEKEFIYTLSFDLRVLKPSEAQMILKTGLEKGLISLKDGSLTPSLSIL
ncbi:MAG: DUF2240 family protein [Candidatus Odinarchaeota archaeon]